MILQLTCSATSGYSPALVAFEEATDRILEGVPSPSAPASMISWRRMGGHIIIFTVAVGRLKYLELSSHLYFYRIHGPQRRGENAAALSLSLQVLDYIHVFF